MQASDKNISATIMLLALLMLSCAPSRKLSVTQKETESIAPPRLSPKEKKFKDYIYHPDLKEEEKERDTIWRFPKNIPADKYFSSYRNRYGFNLSASSKDWLESTNERSPQGLPVKTLIRASDRKVRLRIFDAHIFPQIASQDELDSILAYLFKIEPHSKSSLHPPYLTQVFQLPVISGVRSLTVEFKEKIKI